MASRRRAREGLRVVMAETTRQSPDQVSCGQALALYRQWLFGQGEVDFKPSPGEAEAVGFSREEVAEVREGKRGHGVLAVHFSSVLRPLSAREHLHADGLGLPQTGSGFHARSMTFNKRWVERALWGVLALTIAGIIVGYIWTSLQRRATHQYQYPVLGTVPDFVLTNQFGHKVTLGDLKGKVWVADIIFTRCAGPCPQMTRRMAEISAALPSRARVHMVTLTTDPDYDTPAVLKRYGEKFNADFSRWTFLTGTKQQLFDFAVKGLKLTAIEKGEVERASPADLFIHSTIFVIIDKRGRMRGVFDGDDPSFKPRLLETATQLAKET